MSDSFDQLPDLLSIGQAAQLLHVHPDTLRRWDREGSLRAVRIGRTGQRRYRKTEILAARGLSRDQSALQQMNSQQLLEQMARLLRTVATSQDSRTIAMTVVDEAVRVIGATRCAIYLLDETGEQLIPFVTYEKDKPDGRVVRQRFFPPSISLTAQPVFANIHVQNEVVAISDTFHDPRTTRDFFEGIEARALLVAPLRMRNTTLIGLLCFFWSDSPRIFSDEERIFAEALANQCAIGLENAWLHERLAQSTELLKARAAQLTALAGSASAGVLVYDSNERIVLANQPLADLYAIPAAQITGLRLAEFEDTVRQFHARVRPAEQAEGQTEQQDNPPGSQTEIIELAGAEPRIVRRVVTLLNDQAGSHLGGVVIYHPLTDDRAGTAGDG